MVLEVLPPIETLILLWYKLFLQNIKLKGLNLKLNTCIHFLAPSTVTNLSTLPCIGVCASRLGVVMVATLHEEHGHGWTWFQPQCWSPTRKANHSTPRVGTRRWSNSLAFFDQPTNGHPSPILVKMKSCEKMLVMIFRERHCQSSTPQNLLPILYAYYAISEILQKIVFVVSIPRYTKTLS